MNESHEVDGETWIDVNRQTARGSARQSDSGGNPNTSARTRASNAELWNNMYAILEDLDEDGADVFGLD